jgi:hypothetical protein
MAEDAEKEVFLCALCESSASSALASETWISKASFRGEPFSNSLSLQLPQELRGEQLLFFLKRPGFMHKWIE